MTPEQALNLIPGKSKVFVNYKGNAGHGGHVVERALVVSVGQAIQKNLDGHEYVFVTVKPFKNPAYVLASLFITEMP